MENDIFEKPDISRLIKEFVAFGKKVLKMNADEYKEFVASMEKFIKMNADEYMIKSPPPDVFVPNWQLEVLAWMKRTEIAKSALTTASSVFSHLCWPRLHGDVATRMVAPLVIMHAKKRGGRQKAIVKKDGQILKLPAIKPPNYIRGIEHIEIRYLDNDVLRFYENIFPKLCGPVGVNVAFEGHVLEHLKAKDRAWMGPINRLMEMLAPNVNVIHNGGRNGKRMILNEMAKILPRKIVDKFPKAFGEHLDLMLSWLLNERTNVEKPKLLEFFSTKRKFYAGLHKRIKEEFVHSTTPKPFIIWLCFDHTPVFSPLENERTGEVLTMFEHIRSFNGFFKHKYLARYPKDKGWRCCKQWVEMMWEKAPPSKITININRFGEINYC